MTTDTRPPHTGPFRTRSGVVIGGAYIPPRTPRYADPVDRPKPTGYSRRWWASIVLIAAVAAVVVTLGGCGERKAPEGTPPASERARAEDIGFVCYWRPALAEVDCLRVR